MHNRNTEHNFLTQRPIVITLAALVAFTFAAAPAFAQVGTNATNGTALGMVQGDKASIWNSTAAAGTAINMTLNLGTPLFIEHNMGTNMTEVNENTTKVAFEGNGTLMLPSGNVTTKDRGSAIIYTTNGYSRAYGHVVLETQDGMENATATFIEFMPANSTFGTGTAFIETNSTGQLAELNKTIGAFRDYTGVEGSTVIFWKWSS